MKTIILNVSGKMFEVPVDILAKKPRTRLGKLSSKFDSETRDEKMPIYFSRPASSFEAILDYYQTDELHMPTNVCPRSFQKELNFWELEPGSMETCCYFQYLECLDRHETTTAFYNSIKAGESENKQQRPGKSLIKRLRSRLWSILDYKESTTISRVFMLVMLACVVLSVITLSLGTVKDFRNTLHQCELRDHLQDVAVEDDFYDGTADLLMKFNCSVTMADIENILLDYVAEGDDDVFHEWNKEELNSLVKKLKSLPSYTKRHKAFIIIDFVLISAFTLELILRLYACPDIKRYFFSFINTLDFVVLATTYADLIVEHEFAKYRYEEKGFKIFFYLQMLRVLRLLRYVQHVASIRVLWYTVRTNIKDLCVLFLFIVIGILLFSNFIYFAEDERHFENIPKAWWWGMITMTTVGYGDIVPLTVPGRFIGSLCALSGVLVLSLTIPVFVNTFVSLYSFSHLYERFLKKDTNKNAETIKNIVVAQVSTVGNPNVTNIKDDEEKDKATGNTDIQFQ